MLILTLITRLSSLSGSSRGSLFLPSAPLLPILSSLEGSHRAQPTFTGWEVTCTSLRGGLWYYFYNQKKIIPALKDEEDHMPVKQKPRISCVSQPELERWHRASSPAMLQGMQNLSITSKVQPDFKKAEDIKKIKQNTHTIKKNKHWAPKQGRGSAHLYSFHRH